MTKTSSQPTQPEIQSPPWQPGTRLVSGVLLVLLAGLLFFRLRTLFVPLFLAMLLAYVLHPLVVALSRHRRVSRGLAVFTVYLGLLLITAGTTTGIGIAISQQLIGLVEDLRQLSVQIPNQLEALNQLQFKLGPWVLDFSQANLQPVIQALASVIRPALSQTGALLASVAGVTASVVGWMLAVLVMAYYLLLDYGSLEDALLEMVPPPYRPDFQRLTQETGRVWQSFLRGQLILALVIGVVVAPVLAVLGVRFALVLGLIAGLLEFVPMFGPFIAGAIAVLVALFQGSNWWGLEPWVFALIVLGVFVFIQQVENNVLVPRIIGQSLNMHPLLVLLSALAGSILAGMLGILLAAPTVATLRLWLGYVYRKTVDLQSWPSPALTAAVAKRRRLAPIEWIRRRLPRRGARRADPPDDER